MVKLIKASFGKDIMTFNDDGWFNATHAAQKFDKKVAEWLRLPTTQEYVDALSQTTTVKKGGEIPPFIRTERGRTGGTWLHPKLAVRFAQWLDVKFAVWCDEQIDKIIRGQLDQQLDIKRLRAEAASSYKVMSEVLQLSREIQGKDTKTYHYSNEARLINWVLTGEYGSVDRDALNMHDIGLLGQLEARNSILIANHFSYEERKAALQKFGEQWRKLHTPALAA